MPASKKRSSKSTKTTARRKSSQPAKNRPLKRLGTIRLTALSTLVVAAICGTILFFANPSTLEAAGVNGQITGIGSKCLDNKDGRLANNNPITLWSCDHSSAQNWTLPGDGTIRSGTYCLDIPNANKNKGTKVQLYKCNGTKAQTWTFASNGAIVNPNSGLCLDSQSGKTTNGNPIWMWTCNGTAAQKWTIPKAAVSEMPIGDLSGWKQIFTENFNTNAAEGAFAAANGSVLPGAYKDKFWTYPNGWGDTLKNGRYMPSQTMSVKDGLFRVRMRNEGGVNKVGALLPKLTNKKIPAEIIWGSCTAAIQSASRPIQPRATRSRGCYGQTPPAAFNTAAQVKSIFQRAS